MADDDTPKLDNEGHFNRCIGHALASWNQVEDHLGDVFCACFGSINNLAARGAYLAVINFNARLQMVDAAIQACELPEAVFKNWRNHRNQTSKKADIRNKLTHFSRIRAKDNKGEPILYLLPNFWTGEEWAKALAGKGARYSWPEVWRFGQDFGQLALSLHQLACDVEVQMIKHPPIFQPLNRGPYPDSDTPSEQ